MGWDGMGGGYRTCFRIAYSFSRVLFSLSSTSICLSTYSSYGTTNQYQTLHIH